MAKAMFKIDKGLRALAKFQRKIETVSAISKPIAQAQAKDTVRIIKRNIKRGVDPYGAALKRKKVPDGRKVLHGKTGKLRRYRVIKATAEGFAVGTQAPYEVFHNTGTRRMVKRLTRPDSRGLPKEWARAYETIAINQFRKHFK